MLINLSSLSHWGYVTAAYAIALSIITLLLALAEGRQRRLRREIQTLTHKK